MTLESVLSAITTVVGLVTPAAAAVWLYVQSRRTRRDVREDTEEARLAAALTACTDARVEAARWEAQAGACGKQLDAAQAMLVERDATIDRLRDELSTARADLAACRASLPRT